MQRLNLSSPARQKAKVLSENYVRFAVSHWLQTEMKALPTWGIYLRSDTIMMIIAARDSISAKTDMLSLLVKSTNAQLVIGQVEVNAFAALAGSRNSGLTISGQAQPEGRSATEATVNTLL